MHTYDFNYRVTLKRARGHTQLRCTVHRNTKMDIRDLCEAFATHNCCKHCILPMTTNNLLLLPIPYVAGLLRHVVVMSMRLGECTLMRLDMCAFDCSGALRAWADEDPTQHLSVQSSVELEFEFNKDIVCKAIRTWRNISRNVKYREKQVIVLSECMPALLGCPDYTELLLQLQYIFVSTYPVTSGVTMSDEVTDAIEVVYKRMHRAYRLKLGCTSSSRDQIYKSCGNCVIGLDEYSTLGQMNLAKVYRLCSKICSACVVPNHVVDIGISRVWCDDCIDIFYKVLPEPECNEPGVIDEISEFNKDIVCQIILACSSYAHNSRIQDIQMRSHRLLSTSSMLALSSYFMTTSRYLEVIMW